MIDLSLKASSETAMRDALRPLGYVAADGGAERWVLASHTHALDPVGSIARTRAVFGADGEVVTPAVFYSGWHANLRLFGFDADARADAVRATGLVINPATPSVVWA